MVADDDWRLQGQERYLARAILIRRSYRPYPANPRWDHDHCEFCWAKFTVEDEPDALHEGYSTEDEYRWVCERCVADFQDRFEWTLKSEGTV